MILAGSIEMVWYRVAIYPGTKNGRKLEVQRWTHMHPVLQVYSSPCFLRHSAIGTENFFSISVR